MNKQRLRLCIATILDNIKAIQNEIEQDYIHIPYLDEKLQPIEHDVQVIRSQIEKEEMKSHIDDWKAYERVRQAGLYNMFDPRARHATNLSSERYAFCMDHYSELKELTEEAENE